MKIKFFNSFPILQSIKKQAYKLNLLKNEKIHNVYLISLPEYDNIYKEQTNNKIDNLNLTLDSGSNKKYKVKNIKDGLHKRRLRSIIRFILLDFKEGLLKKKRYMGAHFSSFTLLKNNLHLLLKTFRRAYSKFFAFRLYFPYD